MKQLLLINASPRGDQSSSRGLGLSLPGQMEARLEAARKQIAAALEPAWTAV
jgi:hypothetical protein